MASSAMSFGAALFSARWTPSVLRYSFFAVDSTPENTSIQKFTPQSADGIALYISNSPFVSWLSIFGIRGEAYLLGIIELTTAALLAAAHLSRFYRHSAH